LRLYPGSGRGGWRESGGYCIANGTRIAMTRRRARLYGVLLLLLGVGAATALTLLALKDNVTYFRTPTEIVTGDYPERASGRGLRLGGLVEKGSIKHEGDIITFQVTDLANTLTVRYQGIPPDLFREEQGVVAEGRINADGVFIADRILAKHDEKYMPPEVAGALKAGKKSSTMSKP
jgi:cytochrome c-type biogenesis protein CcmE